MFLFAWCVELPSAVSKRKNNNPFLASCLFFEPQQICPSQVKVIAKWILSGIKHVAEKEQVFLIFHCAARAVSVVITNFQPGPKKKQLALYCNNLLCVCVCVCTRVLHCILLSLLPLPLLWWMVLVKTLLLFLYVTLLSQRKNGPGVHHNNAVMDECGCSNYMRTNR